MQTKIIIRTPKGQAKAMQKRLKPFLLGRSSPYNVMVNDDDNEIIWEVDAGVKDTLRINRNVAFFDRLLSGAFHNKTVQKKIKKHLSIEDQAELNDMLFHHTTVEVVREATAGEIVESNKTWWQRIKEGFKPVD